MGYCRKCGAKVDDLDAFCGNCGARIERVTAQDDEFARSQTYTNKSDGTYADGAKNKQKPSGGLDDLERTIDENIYAFLCFVLGIASFFVSFVAAIVSLVLYKKGMELCEREGKPGADLCRIGRICSKVCIGLTIAAAVIGIIATVCVFVLPLILV